jgi:methyl-accepting chemotaxis protein
MQNWTIAKRLTIGFGVVLLITGALGGFAITRLIAINHVAVSIKDEAVPGVVLFGEIESELREAESVVQKIALSEDPARMAVLDQELEKIAAHTTEKLAAYEKTIVQDEDRRLYEVVKQKRVAMQEVRKEYLVYARKHTALESGLEFDRVMAQPYAKLFEAVQAETDFNKKITDGYVGQINEMVTTAVVWTLVGALIAFVLGGAAAVVIVKSIGSVLRESVSSLSAGAQQVSSASTQVASASQSLSQGSSEQAASLEETSASMEEMASMARRNAENSQSAAGLVAQVDGRVVESRQALDAMVTSMSTIHDSSAKVSKIIKTIDEIAFQTNILALNAAVEAARAGEAGMGFAVVADEVRNLAQRSAQAAKDTASLIEDAMTNAQSGVDRVQQVVSAIEGIAQSVTSVKGLVEEVKVASQQQAQGIDQVSQAVVQMERVTQTTAATAEESAAASEELSAQATLSMESVQRLAMLTGTSAREATVVARPAPAAAAVKPARAQLVKGASAAKPTAEDLLPLKANGTFGSF